MSAASARSSEWLSPTRAWRLIECPASVLPGRGKTPPEHDEDNVNAGTLAHRTLQRWIQARGYQDADPRKSLAAASDACLAELLGGPAPGWTVTRARLLARGLSLADLIGQRAVDEVVSETPLHDHDLRLRGTPDLVLLGDDVVVVDLKTQTLIGEELPPWVHFQLTVYAHLIERTRGSRPSRAEVFSLNRGRIVIPVTEANLRAALDGIEVARASQASNANPRPEVCVFCERRVVCQPHWDAAAAWTEPDCVEGEIVRLEVAATGVVALLLQTPSRQTWVSGIPSAEVTGGVGDMVRLVRLRCAPPGSENAGDRSWRGLSAIAFPNAEIY